MSFKKARIERLEKRNRPPMKITVNVHEKDYTMAEEKEIRAANPKEQYIFVRATDGY